MDNYNIQVNSDFYSHDAETVAQNLLGCVLVHELPDIRLIGKIVETEAYPSEDPASHSYRGKTVRNSSMFLEGGYAYVYKIYGIHNCFNVVTGVEGIGEAVLIRALEPLEGIREMWFRRYRELPPVVPEKINRKKYRELCRGPGRLCTAMGITLKDYDAVCLNRQTEMDRLFICAGETIPHDIIMKSPRIGLSPGRGEKELRRWTISDSQYLSRPGS